MGIWAVGLVVGRRGRRERSRDADVGKDNERVLSCAKVFEAG